MNSLSSLVLVGLVLCTGCSSTAATRPTFLSGAAIDPTAILSGPIAADSQQNKDELVAVLKLQSTRTPADEERCRREGDWSPLLFDNVFGPQLNARDLPLTYALLDTVGRDTMAVCERAKKIWFRPRPPSQDSRVHPAVGIPTNSSYPSGHGAYGVVLGAVLAELAPDLRDQLVQRGLEIGNDRVLGGVHFPSDVEAGRKLGREILKALRASPEFQVAMTKARDEIARARATSKNN